MSDADVEELERLEAERDFLLRSLDDLEAERTNGDIDDESYRALHDDYTARAAAVLRTIRDGVDARPAGATTSWPRRLLVLAVIGAFAAGSAVALASALGPRGVGETASGNTGADRGPSEPVDLRAELEAAVEREPADVDLRMQLARTLEQDGELAGALAQYDEVIRLEPTDAEAHAQSGRVLYLAARAAPEQAPELVARSRDRLDRAIELDPRYPDARFFRAIVLANEYQDFAAAQGDLQRYLILAPNGAFAEDVRRLLADVTSALEDPSTPTT